MEIRWNVLLGKLNMSNMPREFLVVFAVFAQALDSELTKGTLRMDSLFGEKTQRRNVGDIIPIDHDPHGETPQVETNSMQLLVMNHLR